MRKVDRITHLSASHVLLYLPLTGDKSCESIELRVKEIAATINPDVLFSFRSYSVATDFNENDRFEDIVAALRDQK